MSRYYWNFNKDEEVWHNSEDTIEICIEEARLNCEEGEHEFVYVGVVENYVPAIDGEYIVDYLREQAYSECGECCDGWLDEVDEESLETKLNEALQEWLEETKQQPAFGKFSEMYCYELKTGNKIEQ
jgi:hypothetical protein